MTERSAPWDGTTTGDATIAPYDAASEFGRILRVLNGAAELSAHKGGVAVGASGFGDYNATTPGANTARIASGVGMNQGTWVESDANVDVTIPTPSVSTRIDRIVLRKSWAAQTVRVTRIAGSEGAGAPAMTQTFGTTWDVPLWQVSITTGAAITFTDERVNLVIPPHTHATTPAGGQISHAALSGVTSDQHHAQLHVATHASGQPDALAHANLATVTADQHHNQLHAAAHASGQPDQLAHTALATIGTNTHAQIDTHLAANLIGNHGVARLDTTGTQSMGSPTDGKICFARGNGGTITVTTPSGAILVGTVNSGTSFAIANGDSYTFIANGTNWVVF